MFCVLCAIYQQDYAYDKRRYFKLDSRFFVPQGRHIAPIGVELSADECHSHGWKVEKNYRILLIFCRISE